MEYFEILQSYYERKRKDGKRLSMRGMALKLGVSVSFLSLILKGKRKVPIRMVDPLCALLDIDQIDRDKIVRAVLAEEGADPARAPELMGSRAPIKAKKSHLKWETVAKAEAEFIADWKDVAIFLAVGLETGSPTVAELADRLSLDRNLVEERVQKLIQAEFLFEENGLLQRAKTRTLQLRSGKDFKLIRKYHNAHLENARAVLENQLSEADLQRRLITGMTLTVSRRAIPILKQKLQEVLLEIAEECADDTPEDVYQLAVQFFPLTRI